MTYTPFIAAGTIKIRILIQCDKCGASGTSETITVEIGAMNPEQLADNIRNFPLGTSFPVGWSKSYAQPRDILLCPNCNK